MTELLPAASFADLRARLAALPQADAAAAEAARARQNSLTKPPGSLGRLEDLAVFMAGWQGAEKPVIGRAVTMSCICDCNYRGEAALDQQGKTAICAC